MYIYYTQNESRVPYLAFQHTRMGAAAPCATQGLFALSLEGREWRRAWVPFSLFLSQYYYIELNLSRSLLLGAALAPTRKHAICPSAISFIAA